MPARARRRVACLLLAGVWTAALHAEAGTLGYDPARDPGADLRAAVVQAQARGSRILVVVGGEWCSWCHILDGFLKGSGGIRRFWEEHFVTLKVYFDPETPNAAFLGRYPGIDGYPHIFVLDGDGALLHSQDTALLEEGDSYSEERMRAFLTRWAADTAAAK